MSDTLEQLADYIWDAVDTNRFYWPAKQLIKLIVSYEMSDDRTNVEVAAHEARLELFARYLKENVMANFGLDTQPNVWFLAGMLWQRADQERRKQ